MRNRRSLIVVPALMWGTACTPVNTVPVSVGPASAIQYYDLEVPPELEIKSVDFSATAYSEVSGSGGSTSSSTGGRAFVKAYAVRRSTGEQFLLLYEDVARRKKPVQIIRFVPGSDKATRDPAP